MGKIILASASPRRRELLTQIGIEFEIMVSDKEERITAENPDLPAFEEFDEFLAAIKAVL